MKRPNSGEWGREPGPEQAGVVVDLAALTMEEVERLGVALKERSRRARTRQEVAEAMVGGLFEGLRLAQGEPGCALVRCFQTCAYARLPAEYQNAADVLLEQVPSHPNMRCLTLLATRGVRQVWNDVATSVHHQAIPLPSVEVVRRAPMIARLLEQMGVSIERVVSLDEVAGAMAERHEGQTPEFQVFHVEAAEGSPFLPAQEEFVRPFGVRSVVGMGGLLPDGEIFAVILFTRTTVSGATAALFRSLATELRTAFLPFPAPLTFPSVLD